jgi:hypothetical protein
MNIKTFGEMTEVEMDEFLKHITNLDTLVMLLKERRQIRRERMRRSLIDPRAATRDQDIVTLHAGEVIVQAVSKWDFAVASEHGVTVE